LLVLGVAYKKDIDDVRESPALDIIHLLQKKGADIAYCDPHVPVFRDGGLKVKGVPFTADTLKNADCVVIVTDHKAFDYALVAKHSKVVVDTRNAMKGIAGANIVKL
jgi:UDP-N-acetyl-D-glucosamine dehydrogenase